MDLSPRNEVENPGEFRRKVHRNRRWAVLAATVVLIVAAGFITAQGLRNATLFFRNVDEAVEQRPELVDRRFRIQGRVIPSTVRSESGVTTFQITHGCVVAFVQHTADPPELFTSPWIPVVLEGQWVSSQAQTVAGVDTHHFQSDRMLVKHTNEYASVNEQRVSEKLPKGFLNDCAFEVSASES